MKKDSSRFISGTLVHEPAGRRVVHKHGVNNVVVIGRANDDVIAGKRPLKIRCGGTRRRVVVVALTSTALLRPGLVLSSPIASMPPIAKVLGRTSNIFNVR